MFASVAMVPKLPPLDCRIPSWAPADLIARPCPFCCTWREAVLRRPDGLPVAYCRDCGIWYLSLVPTAEALHRFYSGYWRSFRPQRFDVTTARLMRRAAQATCHGDFRIHRLRAILGGLYGKRIVDVGCGPGSFLLALEASGAHTLGVEISEEAADFVRLGLGLPVYGDLQECLAEAGPVDAIVLNDLVEHLVDPAAFLGAAVRGLRAGAIISIWTPNGGAAGTDFASAKEWVGFRVDLEHLQYLSPRTIVLVARKLNLEVEHLETTGYPGLEGIDRPPRPMSWLGSRLRAFRAAVAASPIGPLARSLCRAMRAPRSPDRTTGTYHLFAILGLRTHP